MPVAEIEHMHLATAKRVQQCGPQTVRFAGSWVVACRTGRVQTCDGQGIAQYRAGQASLSNVPHAIRVSPTRRGEVLSYAGVPGADIAAMQYNQPGGLQVQCEHALGVPGARVPPYRPYRACTKGHEGQGGSVRSAMCGKASSTGASSSATRTLDEQARRWLEGTANVRWHGTTGNVRTPYLRWLALDASRFQPRRFADRGPAPRTLRAQNARAHRSVGHALAAGRRQALAGLGRQVGVVDLETAVRSRPHRFDSSWFGSPFSGFCVH